MFYTKSFDVEFPDDDPPGQKHAGIFNALIKYKGFAFLVNYFNLRHKGLW